MTILRMSYLLQSKHFYRLTTVNRPFYAMRQ